jgi:hypothetical protein
MRKEREKNVRKVLVCNKAGTLWQKPFAHSLLWAKNLIK